MAAIGIVIVNWNSGNQLEECINSISEHSKGLDLKVIVVDNNSTDKSCELKSDIHNVKIYYSDVNLGFGMGCNVGASQVDAEYLLFLNPDAAIYAGTLDAVVRFMEDSENADVGICGVQLIDEAGQIARSCARFPTVFSLLAMSIGLDRIFPSAGSLMTEWAHDCNREVDQIIGAFFFVRRKLFEEIGGFDEDFFVYFEEVDFSSRAKENGWRSMYLTDANAYHAGGGTSNQVKARRLFFLLRSRLIYSFKHFNILGAILVLLVTMLLEPLSRSVLAIFRGAWPVFKETVEGYIMLWRWLPQWLFKGVCR